MVGYAKSIIMEPLLQKANSFSYLRSYQTKHMKFILNHDFGIGKIIHVRKIKRQDKDNV